MSKQYRPPYPFEEVIWDDAASNSESWVHISDVIAPEQVVTRGWLVKETEKAVTLAASVSMQQEFEETVGNTMTIPKGMIVSRRQITVHSKKAKPIA